MEYQSLVHSSVRQISLKYLLCSSYSVSSCNFYMFKISSCSFTWVSNSTFLFFVEYHMHVECENFKSWFLCICISTCLGQYVAVKFQCNICINTFCIHVWLYQIWEYLNRFNKMSYKLSKIQKISMKSLSFVLTIIPMHVREESN